MSQYKYLLRTYLVFIKNSVGTKAFRSFYVKNGEHKDLDVLKNGVLSCAFYVSSVLKIFNLIAETHCTVDSTVKDLLDFGWLEIKRPISGCVLVWEEIDFGKKDLHKHIGFYIGEGKAVSNDYKKRMPKIHDWNFNGERKVQLILWNNKLNAG